MKAKRQRPGNGRDGTKELAIFVVAYLFMLQDMPETSPLLRRMLRRLSEHVARRAGLH